MKSNNNKIVQLLALLTIFIISIVTLQHNLEGLGRTILFLILNYAILLICFRSFKINRKYQNLFSIIYFFLLVICLLFFVIGWLPELKVGNSIAGYDPIRYYYQALDLVKNNFIMKKGIINYAGIIYVYAFIFSVFSFNPIVAIILNITLSVISGLILIKIQEMLNLKKIFNIPIAIAILFLFLPEIIWYNILSSREIICMSLFIMNIYTAISLLIKKFNNNSLLILFFVLSLILLGIIRTSVLLFLLIDYVLIFILCSSSKFKLKHIIYIFFSIVSIILFLSYITYMMGSNDNSLFNIINNTISSLGKNAADYNWTNNSIGKLLIAHNLFELILLFPLRALAYLIAPLPSIQFLYQEVNYAYYQNIFAALSSLFYIATIPMIFLSFYNAVKMKDKKICLFVSMFLVNMFAVVNASQIIHERYRIINIPFIIIAISIGLNSEKRTIKIIYCIGGIILFLSLIFYVIYKLI